MTEQSSLESKFEEQGQPAEKYIIIEPLKRCIRCRKFKPASTFQKNQEHKKGAICTDCRTIYMRGYRDKNRDDINEYRRSYYHDNIEKMRKQSRERPYVREYRFLHRNHVYHSHNNKHATKSGLGFLDGTGICYICGEIYPRVLVNHHVIPDDEMVVSLCANCHKYHQISKQEKHMISVLNAIENSKFLWDSDGQPKGLKPVPMWTADLPLNDAIEILKSYDLPGYEPIGVEV